MKKVISGCISLLLVSLCVGAFGEAPRYTLADLREQAAEGWHETYEAYGRTVRIDLDDFVPQAEAAPVLLCGRHALPPKAKRDQLEEKYKVYVEDPKSHTTFIARDEDCVTVLVQRYPFTLDEASGETMLNTRWPQRAQAQYDWDQAYADNNPLTVRQAHDIAMKLYKEVYGADQELAMEYIGLQDRYYSKKTGEPIRAKGGYLMCLRQLLRGVPFYARANRAFVQHTSSMREGKYNDFYINASIIDEVSYEVYCEPLEERSLIHEDIPLCSYEAAKAALEELILSGNIRQIFSLQFGYALYGNPEDLDETFYLVPSWIAYCEYQKSARDEINEYDAQSMYFEASYYRPVIVNAQTGECLDPTSMEADRSLCPPIITWNEVNKGT